jgi:hypothetical protein
MIMTRTKFPEKGKGTVQSDDNSLSAFYDGLQRQGKIRSEKIGYARSVYTNLNIHLSPEILEVMELVGSIQHAQSTLMGTFSAPDKEYVDQLAWELPDMIEQLKSKLKED